MLRRTSLKTAVLIAFLFTLGACDQLQEHFETIPGNAVKGVISQGVVTVYSVPQDTDAPRTSLFKSRTNAKGQFSLFIPKKSMHGPLLVEVSADQNTTMLCELKEGCIDEITSKKVLFGGEINLKNTFRLLGLISRGPDQSYYAEVSALSHLIVSTAMNLPSGLNESNINLATNWVRQAFNLDENPLHSQTLDITDIEALESATAEELTKSLINASFFSESLTEGWTNNLLTVNTISTRDTFIQAGSLAQSFTPTLDAHQVTLERLSDIGASQPLDNGLRIIHSPESLSTQEGESFFFRVHAESNKIITYQWLKDGIKIPEAHSAVYGKLLSNTHDGGKYQVRVSDGEQTFFSDIATLHINPALSPLSITEHPANQTLVAGQDLTLSVNTNSPSDVSVIWQRNGSILTQYSGSTLHIPNVETSNAGHYRAVVTQDGTTLYSDFANVQVIDSLSPVKVITQPSSQTLFEGQSTSIEVLASGGGFLRYQWYKNRQPIADALSHKLTISNASEEDAGRYHVIISNSLGSVHSSDAELEIYSNSADITITEQPYDSHISIGETLSLYVQTTQNSLYSFQWFKNDAALIGENSASLRIENTRTDHSGMYYVEVRDGANTVHSELASVVIEALPELSLTWSMPTERENGAYLSASEIYGYRLEYGYNEYRVTEFVEVVGATNTATTLKNLQSGYVFLRIATIDSDRVTGRFSDVVKVYIP